MERLLDFTAWCHANHRRGFLGELGASTNDLCLQTLSNMLAYVKANADVWLGWTYWRAGPWWTEDMFTIEPINGATNRPQMKVLEKYLPIPMHTLKIRTATQFEFSGRQGYLYPVEASPNLLAGSWTDCPSTIAGTGDKVIVPITLQTNGQGFFRVHTSRMP